MIILAVDISTTNVGWACNVPDLDYNCGTIPIDKKMHRTDRLGALLLGYQELLGLVQPYATIYCTPFSRGQDATRSLWGAAGLLEALAHDFGTAIMDVAEAKVRAYHKMVPPGEMAKGARRKWLKTRALTIAEELGYHTLGSDDAADAVLLLKYAEANLVRSIP
jgi:hypothetical protein